MAITMEVDASSTPIDGVTLNFSGNDAGLELVSFTMGQDLVGWFALDPFDPADGIVSLVTFGAGATGTVQLGTLTVRSADPNAYAVGLTTDSGVPTAILSGVQVAAPTITPGIVTVTVGTGPVITQHPLPAHQQVCQGADVVYTVTVTGTNVAYQWQKDGVDISGATAEALQLTGVQEADGGSYTCVVSDDHGGPITSNEAVLEIDAGAAPVIVQHPEPVEQTVCIGDDVTYAVVANGLNVTYQWRKDGVDVQGATSGTLEVADVGAADAGPYTCVVGDDCGGSVMSTTALLHVAPALAITQHPSPPAQAVPPGSDVTYAVAATGLNVTYQWQMDGMDIPWAIGDTLQLVAVQEAFAGSYACVVSDGCGGSVTSNSAVLEIGAGSGPVIVQQPEPADQTVCIGDDVTHSVAASGLNVTYQWRKDGADIQGATADTLELTDVGAVHGGSYTCVVRDDNGGPVISTAAVLHVAPVLAVTQHPLPSTQVVEPGSNLTYSVAATGLSVTYQWRKDGADIPGATGSMLELAGVNEADTGSYRCAVSDDCTGPLLSNPATLTVQSEGDDGNGDNTPGDDDGGDSNLPDPSDQEGAGFPPLVGSLSVTVGYIELGWSDNSDDEDGYEIHRRIEVPNAPIGQGHWRPLAFVGRDTTVYRDETVQPETTYSYRVRMLRDGLAGDWLVLLPVMTPAASPMPPAAPVDMDFIDVSHDRVTISWTDTADDESGFCVQRRIADGSWQTLATLPPDTTTYSDTDVADQTVYAYRCAALNEIGFSQWLLSTEVTTPPAPDATGLPDSLGPSDQIPSQPIPGGEPFCGSCSAGVGQATLMCLLSLGLCRLRWRRD
ncbi:MAG: hypothetical protein JXQ73_06975 [Phycisphaerae bacterium]|nr:hypothetical protein [Phycisphaerae bacterium]